MQLQVCTQNHLRGSQNPPEVPWNKQEPLISVLGSSALRVSKLSHAFKRQFADHDNGPTPSCLIRSPASHLIHIRRTSIEDLCDLPFHSHKEPITFYTSFSHRFWLSSRSAITLTSFLVSFKIFASLIFSLTEISSDRVAQSPSNNRPSLKHFTSVRGLGAQTLPFTHCHCLSRY